MTYTEEEINAWNEDSVIYEEPIQESSSEDEADESEEEEEERISSSEAVNIFSKAFLWATAKKVSPRKINALQSLREKAVLDVVSSKKHQTKIWPYSSRAEHFSAIALSSIVASCNHNSFFHEYLSL